MRPGLVIRREVGKRLAIHETLPGAFFPDHDVHRGCYDEEHIDAYANPHAKAEIKSSSRKQEADTEAEGETQVEPGSQNCEGNPNAYTQAQPGSFARQTKADA